MKLLAHLSPLGSKERKRFAKRCKVSLGHLLNVAYGVKPCTEGLAIAIDRETGGKVTCEEVCPDADWAYLRGSAKQVNDGGSEQRALPG